MPRVVVLMFVLGPLIAGIYHVYASSLRRCERCRRRTRWRTVEARILSRGNVVVERNEGLTGQTFDTEHRTYQRVVSECVQCGERNTNTGYSVP